MKLNMPVLVAGPDISWTMLVKGRASKTIFENPEKNPLVRQRGDVS